MELLLKRKKRNADSTIGELYINGKYFCFTCEDVDRGLTQSMSLEEIKKKKVHGKTAIPAGRYAVVLSMSQRFKKYLPELVNVPGYAGVRIHTGNTSADTEGCLLPGMQSNGEQVLDSKTAMVYLMKQLQAVEKKEKIWITIE